MTHSAPDNRPSAVRGGAAAWCRPLLLAAMLVAAAGLSTASAQGSDRAWYERLVDGAAGLIYNVAWPTATYDHVTFGSVKPVAGGGDVTFRLHGKSAFAEGDLWLDVVMRVRNGEIAGVDWGEHNGFFPPGLTTSTFIDALKSAMESSRGGSAGTGTGTPAAAPAPVAVSVTCIGNSTRESVNFSLRRGDHKPMAFTLKAGEAMIFTAATSDREFEVLFDNSFAEGYQDGSLRYNADIRSPAPDTCSDDISFVFVASGTRLGLATASWSPGFSSPFNPGLLQSTTKGQWTCAAGFRPYPWPDPAVPLDCIDKATGVIGLSLEKPAGSDFLKISKVYPGSPAARAGLAAGATVLSIDAVSTDGMTVSAAVAKLRAGIGERVRLGIFTAGASPTIVTLVRQ